MPSFTGTYYYTLDPKGRVILPAPLREVVFAKYNNPKLFITNAPFDKCLHLYPLSEWNVLEEKLRDKPKTDRSIQFFMRRVFASAVECELDKHGRLMVPYELRQNAFSGDDVVIVGLMDKIEIWDKARWDDMIDPEKIDVDSYMKSLAGHGI